VVAIHFVSGRYYSFRGAAATIWEALRDGGTEATVLETLRARYRDAPVDLPGEVEKVLAMLHREQLIADDGPASGGGGGGAAFPPPAPPVPWEPARVERYADLEDLLALDPIHDAADEGWPALPPLAPPVK
jgi:hypothetical protein